MTLHLLQLAIEAAHAEHAISGSIHMELDADPQPAALAAATQDGEAP